MSNTQNNDVMYNWNLGECGRHDHYLKELLSYFLKDNYKHSSRHPMSVAKN